MSKLNILPCLDSAELAASRRQELDIPGSVAATLGRSAVKAAHEGFYISETGQEVNWHDTVQRACVAVGWLVFDLPGAKGFILRRTEGSIGRGLYHFTDKNK